jgi:hypothetical protein
MKFIAYGIYSVVKNLWLIVVCGILIAGAYFYSPRGAVEETNNEPEIKVTELKPGDFASVSPSALVEAEFVEAEDSKDQEETKPASQTRETKKPVVLEGSNKITAVTPPPAVSQAQPNGTQPLPAGDSDEEEGSSAGSGTAPTEEEEVDDDEDEDNDRRQKQGKDDDDDNIVRRILRIANDD